MPKPTGPAAPEPQRHARGGAVAKGVITCAGAALVAIALATRQPWLDRHFLPSFFLPRTTYVGIETSVRVILALLGVLLVTVVRGRAGRTATPEPWRALQVVVAAVLALVASEVALRYSPMRPSEWLVSDEEPRRQPDARLGWTLVPARVGANTVAGRRVEYAIDPAGYRVPRVDEPVDPDRPTILFVGESVMFGEGLTWAESVPALVASLARIQSANLAVHGYSTDQAYLRLERELPRFRRPIAVISLFMTALFGRNLDDDRPHLGPGLVWMPAERHGRLVSLAGLIVPYRRTQTVDQGVGMTRDVLRATAELARSRGARPLVVIPQFGAEDPAEWTLRRRVFDGSGVPYLLVQIDAAWRLPWDRHPNPGAARTMAAAVAARLRAPE